jgi:hypothetical protein
MLAGFVWKLFVPAREEVTRDWRKLHDDEHYLTKY